ncbi:MAG: aldo/keto reductase [Chloroflexota bacterium]
MEKTALGNTGLEVSRLGVGLSEIRSLDVDDAASVLSRALDAGINFLDTSACYGASEELIGASVSKRRDEFVLATKAGHVTPDYQGEPWTYKTVKDSVDRSLRRLKTDHVDLVQLHSCDTAVLERGDVVRALQEAREQGKTRFVGYSGDNEAAHWAVDSGYFDTLQTSFNLVDQHARTTGLLRKADQRGMGIIIKRPIANGAWGATSAPSAYAEEYFRRAQAMQKEGRLPGARMDRISLAMAFTFAHPEVDVAIVGTRNPDHMASNARMVKQGLSIPDETLKELYERFERLDDGWRQRT